MGTSESDLSQDVVFDILSSPRRRYVLYHLRTTGETVQLTDLAEEVAAWENDTDPSEITEQERKRVYVSLYQTHIPRLAEVGLIEYDKDTGEIALADQARDIDRYLDANSRYPWQRIYLVLAGLSAALLAVTVVVDPIPELAVSAIIVFAFLMTVIVHVVTRLRKRRSVPDELSMK
ncbi:hypothetical protein GRX03_15345 [Halovenus sp. WSH3]|uniref:DUF7344 domain-containing protein n=1 Tax=Halovenus carboxidivorans TaxID=2692199 RepID=A0A6B0T4I9_9EURY|nr:hypothetical protein [Halovenus carboxidivorans]MXR52974.1 hypothetical protein [Halovenus carboxidivorans]